GAHARRVPRRDGPRAPADLPTRGRAGVRAGDALAARFLILGAVEGAAPRGGDAHQLRPRGAVPVQDVADHLDAGLELGLHDRRRARAPEAVERALVTRAGDDVQAGVDRARPVGR